MLTPESPSAVETTGIGPSVCPRCRARLIGDRKGALRCVTDKVVYRREAGIWRFLDVGGSDHAEFMEQYRSVRQGEQWGSGTADYYRQLPFDDRTGRHADIWRIRAITYRHFLRVVLEPLEGDPPLRILDLGAGNGWLASRLTERGHHVAAVDLDDDPRDGLGAIVHYGDRAPAESLQASFDHLPWPSDVFDLAIYNGSLHYSADYVRTLTEALRVLRPDGQVVVLDTPFYAKEESGNAMVRERVDHLRQQYGVVTETETNEAFLTERRLTELERTLGIVWRVHRPFYGLRWALRPLQNRVLGRREPARFRVVSGTCA